MINIIVSGNGFFADYYFPFAGLSPSLSRNMFEVVVVVVVVVIVVVVVVLAGVVEAGVVGAGAVFIQHAADLASCTASGWSLSWTQCRAHEPRHLQKSLDTTGPGDVISRSSRINSSSSRSRSSSSSSSSSRSSSSSSQAATADSKSWAMACVMAFKRRGFFRGVFRATLSDLSR